jgi:hypothetical protein
MERVLARMREQIDEGEDGAYEALQLYRTHSARLAASGKRSDAAKVLADGAVAFATHEPPYVDIAADAAVGLMDIFEERDASTAVDAESKAVVARVAAAFPRSCCEQKVDFLKAAVRWTTAEPSCRRANGDPDLHGLLAQAFVELGDLDNASKHFVQGEQPAEFLEQLSRMALTNQRAMIARDVVFARCVLQFLADENLRDANVVVTGLKEQYPNYQSHLTVFCGYLVRCCERKALPLFENLCQTYEGALSVAQDPKFDAYLHAIANKFHGLQPEPNLMNMVMSMFGGGGGL